MAYSYKTVPFLGRSQDILNPSLVAEQLNQLISENEASGWSFYQINSVNILVAGSQPGCFAALFGAKAYPDYERRFDMAIFRRDFNGVSINEGEQKNNAPLPSKSKPEAPQNPDAQCPNCKRLILLNSTSCWKCKAEFGENSAWKPLPLSQEQISSAMSEKQHDEAIERRKKRMSE